MYHEVLLNWRPRIHARDGRDGLQQPNWYGLHAVVHQTPHFTLNANSTSKNSQIQYLQIEKLNIKTSNPKMISGMPKESDHRKDEIPELHD